MTEQEKLSAVRENLVAVRGGLALALEGLDAVLALSEPPEPPEPEPTP